ncbi:MAG TPA: lysophospholipid acyltransferase family protein [Solirubrobacteraceae bacterium]|jgi:1-acyl-sn-glycerol-3-phosphate acyltransferase|nr:lysophospholipid acyltransferase family protein [Solirubrobacteraceae bacterium]
MAGTSTTGASRNGHSGDSERVRGALGGSGEAESRDRDPSLPERLLRAIGGQVARRIPEANLDDRDPDYIRETLPGLWLLSSLYFRGEVRGLGNIPESGPVLLVGNHSGGNLTVDTGVFMLAYSAYFGVERELYTLAHNLVVSFPGLGFLKKWGVVAASRENARKALEDGNALLVYPGGDYEVHRPVWERNRVDFDGRKGWIKTALERDVPVVPVVAIGGQETSLFLSRGETLAKLLMLDRAFRLKVLPVSIALPWGLNVGDFLGHVPLPAKITVEALPPIRIREEFGADPDLDEVYDHVTRLMQETLDALAAERRFPVVG